GYHKAPVLKLNEVPLGARRPIACESPLHAETSGPAEIIAVAGADKSHRSPIDRKPRAAIPNPGTAAFAIEQNTIPSVAEFACCGGQPSIVERGGTGANSWICCGDGVLGVGKPIEHRLCADDNPAPELIID